MIIVIYCVQAARDGRRENQTAPERLKRMVIVLDSTLAENGVFMEALVEEVEEAGIEHRVGREGPVGCVRWGRKQRERIVTDDAQVCVCVCVCVCVHMCVHMCVHACVRCMCDTAL